MRQFKNPYYEGPDCVCCKPAVRATEKSSKAYARGVSDTKKLMVDILMDERSRWGSGTLVNMVVKQLIEKISQ